MCFIAALGALGAGGAAAGAGAAAAGTAAAGAGMSTGLAMASTGLQAMGMMSQISAQNRAAEANAAAARQAAANQYDQENESLYNDNQALLQNAMDRALQARSATDLTFVSAFENGASGGVLADVLRERSAIEGRNLRRDADQRSQMVTNSGRNSQGYYINARNRINSVPRTGFNMGHMASLGSNFLNLRMG